MSRRDRRPGPIPPAKRGRNGRPPRYDPAHGWQRAGRWNPARRTPRPAHDRRAGSSRIREYGAAAGGMGRWSAWWCRLDSNQRQPDYECRALPPELRHSEKKPYRAARARAFSLRFLIRRLWSATRFLLFKTSPRQCGAGHGRLRGLALMVAEVGFEPTTFGL